MADLTDIMPNVSATEQAAALDPTVGDGTPTSAPELDPDSWDAAPPRWPTRKWFAAAFVGVGGILTMWATTGSWDQEETIAVIAFATARAVSWLTPNAPQE